MQKKCFLKTYIKFDIDILAFTKEAEETRKLLRLFKEDTCLVMLQEELM